jgi:pyrrolidone-carboxylate peptidase
MRILVTGFEPFGGAETNISRIVMDGIQEEVEKVLLPVSFRNAPLVL